MSDAGPGPPAAKLCVFGDISDRLLPICPSNSAAARPTVSGNSDDSDLPVTTRTVTVTVPADRNLQCQWPRLGTPTEELGKLQVELEFRLEFDHRFRVYPGPPAPSTVTVALPVVHTRTVTGTLKLNRYTGMIRPCRHAPAANH